MQITSGATIKGKKALAYLGVLAIVVVAIAFIVAPNLGHQASSARLTPLTADLSTIDPQSLVPNVSDLPPGTQLQTHTYVSTDQAARTNGTSLSVLQSTGREVGFTRDFLVPKYGDIEVEVVRFRTHPGIVKAYSYFLTLPASRGLPNPVRADGIGERAAVVMSGSAAFVEFMRGRYYVVVTSIPAGPANLNFIGALSHSVDQHIQTYHIDA